MTIAMQLQAALSLTESVLDGPVTPEEVQALLQERAPLLNGAFSLRDSGEAWGAEEATLAKRLAESDRELVDALWRPRKDAFVWLKERYQKVAVEMPCVSQLLGS